MEADIEPNEVERRGSERSLVATISELVANGGAGLDDTRMEAALGSGRLFATGALGIALFGAANGLAQGGATVGWAAVKTVAVAAFALLLVTPSLIALQALAELGWRERALGRLLVRAWATIGVSLAALAPISFLFATSSRLLGSVVVVAVAFVVIAAAFVRRLLVAAGLEGGASVLWAILLVVVALQGATLMRPMLHRAEGEPLWGFERSGPFEQFGRATVVRLDAAGSPSD